jgi:hypothetical protein
LTQGSFTVVLSKRERQYAIGAAALLGGLLVYSVVVSPYFEHLSAIKDQTAKANGTLHRNRETLRYQRELKPAWTEMSANLSGTESEAMSHASEDILGWGRAAGVVVSAIKPDRTTTENKFTISAFHVTASGRMASISRFVWALESAPVPLRVHEIQLKPRKEGSDDLEVQLSVSTLSQGDATADASKTTVSRADSRGNDQ